MLTFFTLVAAIAVYETDHWYQHQQDLHSLTRAGATVWVASRLPVPIRELAPVGMFESVSVIIFDAHGGNVVNLGEFDYDAARPLTDTDFYFINNYAQGAKRRLVPKQVVSDETMSTIARCRDLQGLSFWGSAVNDEQLGLIFGLSQLRYLDLHRSSISPATAASLRAMKSLEWIGSDTPEVKYDASTVISP
jgi:hypothetical protein